MLECIISLDHPLIRVLDDDPVRPEIPHNFRVDWPKSAVYVSVDSSGCPSAVVCVRFMGSVPSSVDELLAVGSSVHDTVVFYTIWSYVSGAGRELILNVRSWLAECRPEIKTFVTLSPPSDMARRFHLRNGASEWRNNGSTVNYLYS